MKQPLRFPWPLTAALILATAYTAHTGGWLSRIEYAVAEARALLLSHEVASDIVIVEIDSHSLRELSEWPWPRRHYARLLQHLEPAGPRSVFLDIDFSARTTPDDDGLFERALSAWNGAPVRLATHFQLQDGEPDPRSLTRPLPRFARHATEVAVTLEQSRDGLVRAMRSSWRHEGGEIPSIFSIDTPLPAGTLTGIDFSISPSSFDSVSFSDLLNGRIAPEALRGKSVFVGATAVELRDVVPVPVYRTLPGVVVQALAAETVRAGPLRTAPLWLLAVLLAATAGGAVRLMQRNTWRRNLLWLAAADTSFAAVSLYLHAVHRIDFPIVPFALVVATAFAAATLRSLDVETLRALAYALRLKRRDALLRSIVESSADGIVSVDASGAIRTANPAASRLLRAPLADLPGTDLRSFVPELAAAERPDTLEGRVTDCTALTADGTRLPLEITVSRVGIDDDTLYTVILRDVSERIAQQRLLEHQARHDRLTGLPNRKALYEYLESLLDASSGQPVALLLLDLVRFTEINDTLGHDVGDEVLGEAGKRIAEALRRPAFVGRIGGDEFAVVLSGADARDAIDGVAVNLVECLRPPVHARGVSIEVGVHIGIALSPDHAREPQELLRRADVAMYAAKRADSWFEYYDQAHDGHTVRRLGMMSELRQALEADALVLHYQPQVNLGTGRVDSVEALLRWNHPTLGNVPPDEFIALAESTQLIRPLTEWTLRRALDDAASWGARGVDLRVAVNLSAKMLQSEDFAADIARMLDTHAVPASRLELEITESAMMLDPARALEVVADLHGLGVTTSIDDFGTGFSSLGYLRDLRVHALKLDKSFVMDVEDRERNRVIVESTAQLAHALGLKIVAEGVETAGIAQYLSRIGYDYGQGYWYSRPVPADECLAWVTRFNAADRRRAG